MRKPVVLLALATFAALSVGIAGCGSGSGSGSDSTASTTTTARDATCAAKDKLQSSLEDLTNPAVLTEGKDGVTDALDEVRTSADTLGEQVQADLQPQVQDVRNALDRLQSDIQELGDRSISDSITKISDDISAVGTAVGTLADSLKQRCRS